MGDVDYRDKPWVEELQIMAREYKERIAKLEAALREALEELTPGRDRQGRVKPPLSRPALTALAAIDAVLGEGGGG